MPAGHTRVHGSPDEILEAWPRVIDQEVALFHALERTLIDALEEASDAGFLEPDRASWDIPSVAPHAQNAHHSGLLPLRNPQAA